MDSSSIDELIKNPRYSAAIKEISEAIDSQIHTIPFVEPQLCTFIDDQTASQLLQNETKQNDVQWEKLATTFHEILEDVLLAECEIQPLEKKRDELWKSFTKSSYAKLIDKYEVIAREEAALIVNYRNKMKEKEPQLPLEEACRSAESANKRLKKEVKSLSQQLVNLDAKMEQQRRKYGSDDESTNYFNDDEEDEMEEQVQQAEAEVNELESQKEALEGDCNQLKEEIEAMMQELVALDPRSVGTKMSRAKKPRRN